MAKASLPKSARKSDPYKWAGKLGIETGPVPIPRWTMTAVPTVSPAKVGTLPTKNRIPKLTK